MKETQPMHKNMYPPQTYRQVFPLLRHGHLAVRGQWRRSLLPLGPVTE